MKRISFLSMYFIVVFLSGISFSSSASSSGLGDCGGIPVAIQKRQISDQNIIKQTITTPPSTSSLLGGCTGAFKIPTFGLGFALPDLSQLARQLCQAAVRQVSQAASSTLNNAMAGTGFPPVNFSGGTTMFQPAAQITNAMGNGFGSGIGVPMNNQNITTQNIGGSTSNTIAPQSNASSLNNAVTGAMNFLLPSKP